MNSSLGGRIEDELIALVMATPSNFESAKFYARPSDIILGDAPEIIGKLLEAKRLIKEKNKSVELSETERNTNLLLLRLLDVRILLQVRACAPQPELEDHVQVCMQGKICVHQRYMQQITA